jgi:hypothetical protein
MRRHDPGPEELKHVYARWLENALTSEGDRPDRSYFELCWVMLERPFTWRIDHDDNRLADAMEIRHEFADSHSLNREELNEIGPCSFIEVLLGLSRRLAFVAGGSAPHWAWQLLVNLRLERMWDHLSRPKTQTVHQIMDTVINRTYDPNGVGGFFPLAWPDRDQREVELWYQLNSYAEEQQSEHY